MKDFCIVRAQAELQVLYVEPVPNSNPVAIHLIGLNFDQASNVVYNGLLTTSFYAPNPQNMIVQVPASQIGSDLLSLQVYGDVPIVGATTGVSFQVFSPFRALKGIELLTQAFLMELISSPGTDLWNPQDGGGLRKSVGQSTPADITQAVQRAQASVLRKQATYNGLKPAEKLLSAKLLGVTQTATTSSAQLQVLNVLNQSSLIGVQ
jgi:hypothetical protein